MRTVAVYHVDYLRKTRIPIGSVVERRKKERGDNYLGLLRLARKVYASSPEEALRIAIEKREVRRAWEADKSANRERRYAG